MLTKKTKSFIIIAIIIIGCLIALNVYFILNDWYAPVNFSHVILIICYTLFVLCFILAIFSCIKRNDSEKQLQGDYILYYETIKDNIRYSDLTQREKKVLLKKAIDDVLAHQEKSEEIDCNKYISVQYSELGYKKSPIFFILNGIIFGLSLLILNYVKNYFILKNIDTFFDVYYPIYHTFFLFMIGFVGITLYRYFSSKGKVVMAFIPCLIIIFLCIFINYLRFWLDINIGFLRGDIILIDSAFKLILYPSIVAIAFILKRVWRKWQRRNHHIK
jgi:hypothetical protein